MKKAARSASSLNEASKKRGWVDEASDSCSDDESDDEYIPASPVANLAADAEDPLQIMSGAPDVRQLRHHFGPNFAHFSAPQPT